MVGDIGNALNYFDPINNCARELGKFNAKVARCCCEML